MKGLIYYIKNAKEMYESKVINYNSQYSNIILEHYEGNNDTVS